MQSTIPFVDEPLVIRRQQLKNHDFTIICQNCVGGYIYHQMGMKFLSPTINLFFFPADFCDFVKHLRFYLESEMVEDTKDNHPFPVGILGNAERQIRIYFNHYHDFDDAKRKWVERAKRVNYDNIYVIGGDAYGEPYSDDDFKAFDKLPYRHKVLLTGRNVPEVKSSVMIPDCNINGSLGEWWNKIPHNVRGSLHFEYWNYVNFLNQK
ncbi:DUF1919 domain-containing protein [Limosilactobacillus caecicola]|uniref:DUF1919 domain-containing protein n=1 Tax=Limosilactobacillus caecicola TaxID=2941332 RepID=UPI00203CCC23|nr:DUF1919 domain-containing protein [Limosilactobacillus caecicola]